MQRVFSRVHPLVTFADQGIRSETTDLILREIPELSTGVITSGRIPTPSGLEYVVPRRDAYARILHPITSQSAFSIDLWDRVPRNAIGSIASRQLIRQFMSDVSPIPEPLIGSIDRATSRAISRAMSESVEDEAVYIFWSGRGELFTKQGADDIVCRGPINAASEFFVTSTQERAHTYYVSPSLWCDPNLSWCVTTETDSASTYVAGPTRVIDAIVHAQGLVAVPAKYDDPVDDWHSRGF